MSISDTASAPSGGAPATKLTPAKPTAARRNRIRRGQKLDEVVLLAEQRMHSSDEPRSTSSVPTAASSSTAGPSSSANAGGDSPFQLQEYLAMLVRRDPHAVDVITALPTEADIEASSPDKGKSKDDSADDVMLQNVDTDIWVYEQLRRLVLDLTTPWLTSLQQECDKETRETCAAMNAGDWMYLCASHGEEKQCCAIDYMVHTLDGATSLLNSARHFPSRTYVPNTSLRHFGSIARRLSRIFVHAWCYHRETFLACEAETSLYERFFSLVETYDLTATDNLPPRPSQAGSEQRDDDFVPRGNVVPNGTTAKRERSGTAAMRSLMTHSVDAVGLVPPPAPSPRPTAILSRPDHDEADDHAPSWATQPNTADQHESFMSTRDDDDDDDDDEEDGEEGGETTQKLTGDDEDATISLRGSATPATLAQDEEKKQEEDQAPTEAAV